MRVLVACSKMLAFALLTLITLPLQFLVLLFCKGDAAYIIPRLWHGTVCKIFGLKVQVVGEILHAPQRLFMSNHISYLDIPVIGSVLKASFVAKSDVQTWPVFGFLSKLQQTAFINRKRTAIVGETQAIGQRLNNGRDLIIFPEGTSTDGQNVVNFKSSLFSLALSENNQDLYIQPMTLRVESSNGMPPQTQEERDLYAWHIAMDTPLASHLWHFAKHKGAEITLIFHDLIKASEFDCRKTLAKACHERVTSGLSR